MWGVLAIAMALGANEGDPDMGVLGRMERDLRAGAVNRRVSLVPWGDTALVEGQWNTLFECEGAGAIKHIWVTFPPQDRGFGRRNLIRMYWDGEEEPSVEAPLGDFFGVPFGFSGTAAPPLEEEGRNVFVEHWDYEGNEFRLDSEYLTAAPNNGLNAWFTMPFSEGARIEILPEQIHSGGGFYAQIDYVEYPKGLPKDLQSLRFHAQYRFENPCPDYGNYVFLDATGRGALLGLTLSIEANPDPIDFWPHGGGDTIFLDGETNPHALHGIGTEDFFGQSWGVLQACFPYLGTTYYEIDPELKGTVAPGQLRRLHCYRWFVKDPLVFQSSIRGVMGCMANRYDSVAYWYQEEPHTPFFRTPPADQRMPGAEAPAGTHDVAAAGPRWRLYGPLALKEGRIPSALPPVEPGEPSEAGPARGEGEAMLPEAEAPAVEGPSWASAQARHHFVDFKDAFKLPTGVYAIAVREFERDEAGIVRARLAFDDEAVVAVNGERVFSGRHENGFEEAVFDAPFRKGANRVTVALSNHANTTFKLWTFALRFVQ